MSSQTLKKHPKGLYLLFFVELWERFSFYGMRGILILYLTKNLFEGGLGIHKGEASLIYGYFTGLVYFTPIIGGWLADRYLGKRKSVTIGGLSMALGQFILFMIKSQMGLYLGLLFIIIGNGFFKPNISTLVGDLYEKNDHRKDSAFSIFYMGINLGGFLAPLLIGYLAEEAFCVKNQSNEIIQFGYQYGFLASCIGMLIGQLTYFFLGDKYLKNIGKYNHPEKKEALEKQLKTPLTKKEKDQILSIFIFSAISIFFWCGFEQTGSSISIYTDQYIQREISLGNFSFLIPTAWFQSINSLFIIALAPLFALFWKNKWGRAFSTPAKMGMAMILLGLGFLFMIGAIFERGGNLEDYTIKANMLWIVFTYLFHTLGELCLSPVGLSVTTKLSPLKLASFLTGIWFFAAFVGNILGGYIAQRASDINIQSVFISLIFIFILMGFIILALSKWISKKMHGIK